MAAPVVLTGNKISLSYDRLLHIPDVVGGGDDEMVYDGLGTQITKFKINDNYFFIDSNTQASIGYVGTSVPTYDTNYQLYVNKGIQIGDDGNGDSYLIGKDYLNIYGMVKMAKVASVPSTSMDWGSWTSNSNGIGFLDNNDLNLFTQATWFDLLSVATYDRIINLTVQLQGSGDNDVHSVVMQFGYGNVSIGSITCIYALDVVDYGPEPSRSSCTLLLPAGVVLQYKFSRIRTNNKLGMYLDVVETKFGL